METLQDNSNQYQIEANLHKAIRLAPTRSHKRTETQVHKPRHERTPNYFSSRQDLVYFPTAGNILVTTPSARIGHYTRYTSQVITPDPYAEEVRINAAVLSRTV